MSFGDWYRENLHHKPDINSGIGATMKMQWDFQQDKIEKLEQENKKLSEIKPLLVTIYDYLNIENEGVNKTEQDICFKIKEILDKV